MPTRLPLDRLLVPVRQIGARISASSLARYASAVLFLPLAPSAADWQALPHAAMLRALHERKVRKAGDTFHLRVGAASANACWWSPAWPTEASTFERLQAAGKLARSALEGDPKTVAGMAAGLYARMPPMRPSTQSSQRSKRPPFASRPSKASPNHERRSLSIDLARRGKLHELDLTLATAAGNNLARWLTALPPNTLDAAGLSPAAETICAALEIELQILWRDAAQAPGVRRIPRGGARQCHCAMPASLFCRIARAAPQHPPSAWSAKASASTPAARI